MIVLPQMVAMRWHNRFIKWYTEKGYVWSGNDKEFSVYVLDLPKRSNKTIEVICDYCLKTISKKYIEYNENRKIGNGMDCCNSCRGIKTGATKTKYTFEIVNEEFSKRGFQLLEIEYLGFGKHHRYICKNGHETSITFKNLLKDRDCKKCSLVTSAKKRSWTQEEVKQIFEDEGCILISTYNSSKQKLNYICSCGTPDSKTLSHFKRGQRCDKCALEKTQERLRLDFLFVKSTFEANGCTLLSDKYEGMYAELKYICKCGKEDTTLFYGHKREKMMCFECSVELRSGENHWKYNTDLTDEERINGRNIEGYNEWRFTVYKRDNFTCQCCGQIRGNINAHHLDGYHWCKERRLDIRNGITLCEDCHCLDEDSFHRVYSNSNNTEAQFWEWIENKIYKHIEDNGLVSSFLILKNKEVI